jgi:hypothetical protein
MQTVDSSSGMLLKERKQQHGAVGIDGVPRFDWLSEELQPLTDKNSLRPIIADDLRVGM